ncbi:unnamed protein product, partial [Rodentolepis nana]|uniref:C2H2-type domain-containing protein n=1 Tax=Rodentolepis nana TaxID=102285 RepID=A0A0R3T3Q6_RODNA
GSSVAPSAIHTAQLARHLKVHSKEHQLGSPNRSKCIPGDSTSTTNENPLVCELSSDNAIAPSNLIDHTKHRIALPHTPPPSLPQAPHNHPRPLHTTTPPTTHHPHPHPQPPPPPPTALLSASATTTDISTAPTLGTHFQLPHAAVTSRFAPPHSTFTYKNSMASVAPPLSASTPAKFSVCPSLGIALSHHFSSSLHFATNSHSPPSSPSPIPPPTSPLSFPPTPRLSHSHAHVHVRTNSAMIHRSLLSSTPYITRATSTRKSTPSLAITTTTTINIIAQTTQHNHQHHLYRLRQKHTQHRRHQSHPLRQIQQPHYPPQSFTPLKTSTPRRPIPLTTPQPQPQLQP